MGKGHGKRANVMYGRNNRHQHIQGKLSRLGMCVEVRLVAEGLSEASAHALEVRRIAFWREAGIALANLTAGGEGTTDPAPETRARMRAAKVGRKLTEEHKRKIREGTREALATPEMRARLSASMKVALAAPEAKANRSRGQKARIRTKEHYEKVALALTGRKLSPEHAEKARRASVGRKQSPGEIERRRTSNTGRKRSPEFCARMKAMWTPERKAAQGKRTAEMNRSKSRYIQPKLFEEIS